MVVLGSAIHNSLKTSLSQGILHSLLQKGSLQGSEKKVITVGRGNHAPSWCFLKLNKRNYQSAREKMLGKLSTHPVASEANFLGPMHIPKTCVEY